MLREVETSKRLEFLSPSSYENLRACRLRSAFAQLSSAQAQSSPAAKLGTICHRVLDEMVSTQSIWEPRWLTQLESFWQQSAEQEAGTLSVAERWPNYQLKRARLGRTAARLRELLVNLPVDAVVIPEQPMVGLDGRLRGRPDLVIRARKAHRVIDYKSGPAVDRQTLATRPTYERQLRLYALLEAEASGHWPDAAHLFPLEGEPVAIGIAEVDCREVAADAMRILDLFNEAAPGRQPPTVSPQTCSVCSYATQCRAFWSSCTLDWASSFLAVHGVVSSATITPLGGVSLQVRSDQGSIGERSVLIRNIDTGSHPDALYSGSGTEIAATGLRYESSRGSYRLTPLSGLRFGELTNEIIP